MSLFEPLVFPSGLAVRNRAFLAPLTNKQSRDDGSLSDDELRWMCSRAEGGFGLVETCAAHVARDGQNWPGQLGIFDDALLPGLTRLAAEIRQRGPASIFQLFHAGGRSDPTITGVMPWGPSDADGIRAATEDDIQRGRSALGAPPPTRDDRGSPRQPLEPDVRRIHALLCRVRGRLSRCFPKAMFRKA